LKFAFRDLTPFDRARHIADLVATGKSLDGLMGAWHENHLVGAMFSQISAGRTAFVRLPQLLDDEPLSTALRLFSETWNFLSHHHVLLAQTLLPSAGSEEQAMLRRARLQFLANLFYLIAPKDVFPNDIPPTKLDFEPYRASAHTDWLQLFAATQQKTLDCANLNDPRTPNEILTGFRAIGTFHPNHWQLARHNGRPLGCVLLADHPRLDTMELLYLGLIPNARGQGYGRQLVRRAQWLAQCTGRGRLVAAVDAANTPAVQTYTATGFQTWQRRELFVRRLSRRPIGTHRLNSFSTRGMQPNPKIRIA
jgi:GNAT superfamily N-acetyltransferase